jgi:hypothetical protein
MTAKFAPTDEQRRAVRAMSAYGIPQDDIAKVIDIAPKTLRLAFRAELDKAAIEATAKVAETCYQMAISGQHPAATFFWLKTRAGWRETNRHEHFGADGGPIEMIVTGVRRASEIDGEAEDVPPEQMDVATGVQRAIEDDAAD